MSRSNLIALDGKLQSMVLDAHNWNEEKSLSLNRQHQTSSSSTLVPSGSTTVSNKWSDSTLTPLTGSFSGRYSTNSWGADESEFEKEMADKVKKKFDVIDAALYDKKSTGNAVVDAECHQWSTTFPHLVVQGVHLVDSMDDGTDMVDPDPFMMLDALSVDTTAADSSHELEVVGRHIEPKVPQGHTTVYEEIIAADGVIEEYFAFDNSVEEKVSETAHHSKLKRHHGLPPLTPNAAVKDTVCNLIFDQIWNETVAMLQPLVTLIRERVSIGQHSSNFALTDVSLPPLAAPQDEELLHQEPYILRGVRDPPTLTRASGPSGAKFLRFKHSSTNLSTNSATLPQINDSLSGVMQIRSVSLQHRMPSITLHYPSVNDMSREGTPTVFARPDTSHALKSNTPIPARLSDFQLPTAPGARLSSRMASKRNIMLRPIDRPKTPALEPIDNGIRGYKLSANVLMPSPPQTPFTRNNQLPPLETTLSSGMNVSYINSLEKSPPFQLRTSARDKNRVTFNSRIVSAEFQDAWKSKYEDLRPSTTTNSFRQDISSKGVGRKTSDHTLQCHGNMKVVGHAAGHHSTAVDPNAGVDYALSRERFTGSIAEDDEHLDYDAQTFAVTGTAGFLQSRPSARNKLRGHVR